jgi:hypothetical protein
MPDESLDRFLLGAAPSGFEGAAFDMRSSPCLTPSNRKSPLPPRAAGANSPIQKLAVQLTRLKYILSAGVTHESACMASRNPVNLLHKAKLLPPKRPNYNDAKAGLRHQISHATGRTISRCPSLRRLSRHRHNPLASCELAQRLRPHALRAQEQLPGAEQHLYGNRHVDRRFTARQTIQMPPSTS